MIELRSRRHVRALTFTNVHVRNVQVTLCNYVRVKNADTSANFRGREKSPPSRGLGPLAINRMSMS